MDKMRSKIEEAADEVHGELDSSHRENVYHQAMLVELSDRDVSYTTEATIPVMYKGMPVARGHPDLIVEGDDRYIVELKSGRNSGTKQLERYLQMAADNDMDIAGGFVVTFGKDDVLIVER
jgi:GxxExxY protein